MLKVDASSMKVSALTAQERECLRLVAENLSSKEIGRVLGISKASVDTYCNRARAKLGAPNRRAAARMLLDVEPPPPAPPGSPAGQAAETPARPLHVSLLPPLASLGPWQRVGLIIAGAAALALAFGTLLAGLFTLDFVASYIRTGVR